MKGKLSTKTIAIGIVALLVLGAAATGAVLFLNDSGEASAAGEGQNVLSQQVGEENTQLENTENEQGDTNTQDQEESGQNEEDGQTQEDTDGEDVDNNEEAEGNTSTSQSSNGNQSSSTNQSTSGTQTEPAPTTVERERVISETTTLGWSNIGLNSTVGASGLAINYNNLQYKVEYYFDGILDEEATDIIGENSKGTIIDTYEAKVKPGYKFEKVENLPLTVTENEEENVIKVYYVKDETQTKTLKYTVEYYVENVLQENDTEVKTEEVWVNDPETMEFESVLLDKEYIGYQKVSTDPETVGETVENGAVIKVYYEKDDTQTKTLKYTVEYYVENVKQEKDTVVKTEKVWVNAPEIMDFDGTLLNKEYEGYKKEKTEPEAVGTTVENGAVIKVYYTRRTYRYIVEHYTENINTENTDAEWIKEDTVIKNGKYGTNATYELNEYPGFANNPDLTVNGNATVPANNNLVIKLYYEANDYSYTVNYFYNGVQDKEATYTVEDKPYGTEVTYVDKSNNGEWDLNEKSTTDLPLYLGKDGDKLVVNVYYVKPDITIKKVVNNSSVNAGEEIEYTITLTNKGGAAGTTTVTDELPSKVEYVPSDTGDYAGIYDSNTRKITWSNVTVGAKGSETEEVVLKVKVKAKVNTVGHKENEGDYAKIKNTVEATNGVKVEKTGDDTATTTVNEISYTTQEIYPGDQNKDNVNIVLVLDISTSMREDDAGVDNKGNKITRIEAAKSAMTTFVNTLWSEGSNNQDATISIVLFNGDGYKLRVNGDYVSTYSEKTALLTAIDNIEIDESGTNMSDALDETYNLITGTLMTTEPYKNNSNVVIFLGDGDPSQGDQSTNGILRRANNIKGGNARATMYTIGFGTSAARPSNNTGSAYYILKNMASSDDKFKTAITGVELANIFTNIPGITGSSTAINSANGTITVNIDSAKKLDRTQAIEVKQGETTLITIPANTTTLPSYLTCTDNQLVLDINAYNSSVEEAKAITEGTIEIVYYVQYK